MNIRGTKGLVTVVYFCWLIYENRRFFKTWNEYMSMKNDHYNVLMEYLSKSVKPALLNIKVVSYLFVSVLLIGGAGVWM